MKITLQESDVHVFLLSAANGQSIEVRRDRDFPGLASLFGWTPCYDSADDIADCDQPVDQDMIEDARDFLRAHTGDTADDPGYF